MVSRPSVTTTEEGIAAGRQVPDVQAGRTYTLEEDLPESDVGDWALESVTCTGGQSGPFPLGRVTVPDQGSAACTFRNRFTPAGRIRIFKRTLGGTARTSFQIRPVVVKGKSYQDDLAGKEFQQVATTTKPDSVARAKPKRGPQDSTEEVDVGSYAIAETVSVPDDGGVWRSAAVTCDQTPVWSEQGRIVVTLTADNPTIACGFTNVLDKRPTPPIPPEPPTPPTPPTPAPPQGSVLGQMAQATPRRRAAGDEDGRAAPDPPRPQRALPRRGAQPRAGHRPRRLRPGAGEERRAREPVAAHQQGQLPRGPPRFCRRRQPAAAVSARRSR